MCLPKKSARLHKVQRMINDKTVQMPDGVTTYPYGYGC